MDDVDRYNAEVDAYNADVERENREGWGFALGIFGLILAVGSLTTGIAIYGLIGNLRNGTDPWKGEQGALPVLWSFLLGLAFYAILIFAGWVLYRIRTRKRK